MLRQRRKATAHIRESFKTNVIQDLINQGRHDEILNDPEKRRSLKSYLNNVEILPEIVNKIEYVKMLETDKIYELLNLHYDINDQNILIYCLLRISKNRKYLRMFAEEKTHINIDVDMYDSIIKRLHIIKNHIRDNLKDKLIKVPIRHLEIATEVSTMIEQFMSKPDDKIYQRIKLLTSLLRIMKRMKKTDDKFPGNQEGYTDHQILEKREAKKFRRLERQMKNSKTSSSIKMFRTPTSKNKSFEKELDTLIEKIKIS